jgi:cytoskeletal protein CcmA (bactofilin family)
MAILTKAQLEALNQSSFPDQSTEAITPAILRNYNTQTIDTLVDSLDTGSFTTDAEFNAFTSSTNSSITQLNASSASQQISINALNGATASLNTSASLALTTASFSGNTLTFTKGNGTTFGVVIPDVSGSTLPSGLLSSSVTNFTDYSASVDSRINAITASGGIPAGTVSSSAQILNYGIFATTGSNVFVGNQTISGSLFVSGSEVLTGTLSASSLRVENNTYLDGTLTVTNDTLINGDVTIQSATPNLKLRDTSGGGFSSGYDLRVDTGSFEIYDDTHNRDVLSDFFDSASASHTTSLTSEIIVISGSTSVTLIGNVSASIISASTINGLGDPLAFSTSVDSRLDGLEAATSSYVTSAITASSLVTASFSGNTLTFTKGDSSTFGVLIPDVSGSTIDTGSFATTGSNTFIGNETFSNTDGNGTTLTPFSGSLVFTPKAGFASSSSLQNHLFISASATGQTSITNIIFNTSAQSSPTGSVIISGSQNIFPIPTTNTAGFQRRITTGNLALSSNTLPQFTASMSNVPVNYNSNIHGNFGPIFRGPISSSAYSLTGNLFMATATFGDGTESMVSASAGIAFNVNLVLNSPTFRAGRTQLSASVNANNNVFGGTITTTLASSSITYNNNSFYGTSHALLNAYYAPSAVANNQRVEFLYNLIGGQSTNFFISGSNTTTTYNRQINNNFVGGNFSEISASANGDNSSLLGTIIYGNNINVNANSPYSSGVYGAGYGSAFIGRYNATNGTRANSAETIFAVGTGTSFSNRKTGFLIDSGSNTFVEGTLNVSGSTSFNGAVNITGSLTSSLTLGYVWVGGAGNVSTLVATSSFSGVTSAITASSLVTASVNLNTITFTKGDSSTFAITVDTGSGGGSVPEGTVSSSAQIVAYNKFATTGSNTFNEQQFYKSTINFIESTPKDSNMSIQSVNKTTMYLTNVSEASGFNSGSLFILSTDTGSNGYGFSGSATFQMSANYGGKTAQMQVANINGVGTSVYGFADNILFAKSQGFPNTPSDTFKVDAASIELSGSIKVNTGSSGSAGNVNVLNGEMTVNNGLVTSNSIILLTTQALDSGALRYAGVHSKTNGSFTIKTDTTNTINVAYLIINPIT